MVWTAFFQANYDALTYHVILTDTGGYYLISSEEYPVSEYTSTGDGGLDLLTDQSDLPGHFFLLYHFYKITTWIKAFRTVSMLTSFGVFNK